MPTLGMLVLPTLGATELLLLFGIVVLIFGANKIPQLGKGLGEGIRFFKKGLKGDEAQEIEESSSRDSS